MKEQSKYAEAGVDFNAEHAVVEIFKEMSVKTKAFTEDLVNIGITPLDDEGLFVNGVKFKFKKLVELGYEEGVILYGTDGAGTKPLAHQIMRNISINTDDTRNPIQKFELLNLEKYTPALSIGIDAVAMVVNDMICAGARPLHISDYIAWKIPSTHIANDLANGLFQGAKQAKATIVGGENASLKEMITGASDNAYDICAFGSGIILNPKYIEKPLDGSQIQEGDVIIGLRSSGVHCNGISLARKTLINYPLLGWNGKYEPNEVVPELEKTPVQEILTPTIIYVESILDLLDNKDVEVHGIVNITGEGIANLGRLLERTDGLGAKLDFKDIAEPHPVFKLIQKYGDVSTQEMYNDFNMGWGMYVIVSKDALDAAYQQLNKNTNAVILGEIVKQENHEITGIAYDSTELKF